MTPEQASEKYHWIKYNQDTNTIEMYLDNHMLASARQCEAKFYLEHILWLKPKFVPTKRDDGKLYLKPWALEFGTYLHTCLEEYYGWWKLRSCPPEPDVWMKVCRNIWDFMQMENYANAVSETDVKKFNEIKGWEGVAGLLIEYYAYYRDMRVRTIDTEISFGYGKEVAIGTFKLCEGVIHEACKENANINCYLTGRIDLLIDNGYKIGPVDHKHTHRFDGYEHQDFNPHDGICGYILTVNEILKKYQTEGLTKLPFCSGGWIHHLSDMRPSVPRDKSKQPGPRFKVTPIDKSPEQLEDYKARQLSTFRRIAELVFNNKVPEWNTLICNNIFFRPCEFKPIHEQPSNQWPYIIKQFYEVGEPWDTRKMDKRMEKETLCHISPVNQK